MRTSVRLPAAVTALTLAGAAAVAILPAGADTTRPLPGVNSAIPASVIRASAAPGSQWHPESARYAVGERKDVPVTMRDGTVLRADVYFPADASGKQARGRFPVIMTQTPYGKGAVGATPGGSAGDQTGPSRYLVQRGFIDAVVDVRGTGDSQGYFDLFDPKQDADGVRLVHWAAKLPGSTGKVGLYGASYLGINQILTAGLIGTHSPLKAIFPVVAGNDLYKDTAFMGGLIDAEFDSAYLPLTAGLDATGPVLDGLQNPSVLAPNLYPTEIQHLEDLGTYDARFFASVLAGEAPAYDDGYWQARNPVNYLQRVVDNGIPAYLVGGEFDLFQRGAPLNFAGLQNAWAGRPVTAPMRPDQRVTGRYQLLDGPFGHLTGATANLDLLMLEWFDTWLKGERTGMDRTPTPLHYYDLGTGRYTEHARFPFEDARPTRYYFDPATSGTVTSLVDHSLSRRRPGASAADTLAWTPAANPCGRPTDQWEMGGVSLGAGYFGPTTPCVTDDRPGRLSPGRASYTTAPLRRAQTIAGPIDVTVFAKATTAETEWVAEVEDVAPDGTSTPLTEGALRGSLRATTRGSWRGGDGQVLLPARTYSAASAKAVPTNALTRYDIEVFPTYATLPAGHRIRVTLSTGDTPHLMPTATAAPRLLGGVYQVGIGGAGASAVEIPLIPAR